MVKIPLALKLKRESQKKIARAQDIIVDELFKISDKAVLHGGTGIWRCYRGNRFSEDVDVYIPRDLEKLNQFFDNLLKKGFVIEKKKIGENSVYSNLKVENIFVRFEAVFKTIKGELKDFETIDGNYLTVNCLNAEELVKEKASAYSNRLKIRDLYDVFFLLRHIVDKRIVEKEIKRFVDTFKKPVDEANLKILIIEGLVPRVNDMLNYIKREVK